MQIRLDMSDYFSTSVKVQKYDSLLERMKGKMFSWAMAQHIVGGEKRLARLMEEEKIHGFKPEGAPNTQWQINAAEVLSFVKPISQRVNFA